MIRALLVTVAIFAAGTTAAQQAVSPGTGAVLRVLDKVSGQSKNYELASGQRMALGQLSVALRACRYPQGNPSGEAYAFLEVSDQNSGAVGFSGWMIASSPALNAMEHPRYDVWVLRCKTS